MKSRFCLIRQRLSKSFALLLCLLAIGLTAFAQPIISSLSTYSGLPGSSVTISGSGFNATAANNLVYFGGAKATVVAASGTSLTVTVPTGATNSAVSVYNTATHLTGYTSRSFRPAFNNTPYMQDSIHLAPYTLFGTGNYSGKSSFVDLDLDGKTDVLIPSGSHCNGNALVLNRNTGTPGTVSFAGTVSGLPAINEYTHSSSMSDIDGDGKADLVIADNAKVSVARNISSGTTVAFGDRVDFPVSGLTYYDYDVVSGDVDGDGKSDVIFISTAPASPYVYVLRNTATPGIINSSSFAAPIAFPVQTGPSKFLFEDIDGDGKRDIVCANSIANSISILRNTSTAGTVSFALAVNFANPDYYPSGACMRSLAIGDLNGDGKPDICVTSFVGSTVHIYQNLATPGSFTSSSLSAPLALTVGSAPRCATIGDLNGDGKADLLVGNYGDGTVHIFRGLSGSGTITASSFAPRQICSTTPYIGGPSYLELCDMDNDGKQDVVVMIGCAGTWSVLRNAPVSVMQITGSASLCTSGGTTTLSGYPAGGSWSSSNTAIATVGSTGVVTGMTGTGTVTITYSLFGVNATAIATVNPAANATITGVNSICTGLTSSFTNTIPFGTWTSSNSAIATVSANGVVTGVAAGSATISYSTGCGAAAVKVANIRIVPAPITGTLAVSVGTTTALSTAPTGGTWMSGNTSLATVGTTSGVVTGVADGLVPITYKMISTGCLTTTAVRVNTDNIPPKIYSVSSNAAASGTTITIAGENFNTTAANNTVYFGATKATVNSASTTELNVTVPSGSLCAPVCVLNNGVSLSGSSAAWFLPTYDNSNNVAGSFYFNAPVNFPIGSGAKKSVITDIDGDGKPDIVVVNSASNTISVLRNTSTTGVIDASSFAGKVDFATGSNPVFVAVADVNQDGKPDILVVNNGTGTVSVFKNVATAGAITSSSLAAKVDYPTAATPVSLAIADIDGNGKPDLAVCNQNSVVSLLRNNTSGGIITTTSFGARVDLATSCNAAAVAFGDLDGDLKPDMVVAGTTGTNKVYLYRNAGSTSGALDAASFETPLALTTTSTSHVLVHDMDGDGKQDIICQGNGNFFILRNLFSGGSLSSGSFASPVTFSNTDGGTPGGLAIADIDGDTKPDVAAVGSWVSLYRNTSSGSITSSSFTYQSNIASSNSAGVVIGDLDGDGKPDMATQGPSNMNLSIYRNYSEISAPKFMCTGSTYTLSAGVAGGEWSSSDTAIAAIDATTGIASALTAGAVTITYSYPGGAFLVPLIVNSTPAPITGPSTVCQGSTVTLSTGGTGTGWQNGDASIAYLTWAGGIPGVYTGAAAGTTTIKCYNAAGCFVSTSLTVNPFGAGTLSGVATITIGETATVASTISGGVWSTSNSKATVSADGVVTGVAEGNTTISYQVTTMCGTATATKAMFISMPIAPITGSFNICASSPVTLASGTAGGTWTSGNPSVATITAAGILTGATTGTATITYAVSSSTVTQVVTVNPLPTVDLIMGATSLSVGGTTLMSNAISGGVWSSSAPAVATVSESGLVTGITAGTAEIIYTKSNSCLTASTSIPVVVTSPYGIGTITGTFSLCTGTEATLSNTPAGGTWSSSNAAVATIDETTGVVEALAAGITSVSYTYMGNTVSAVVTVLAIPTPAAIAGIGIVCMGSTTTLSNAMSGGTWSIGDVALASINSAGIVSGTAAGVTVVSYTASNTCGSAFVTKTITVNSLPAAGSITGIDSVCAGSSITLASTTTGGTWSSSNGSVATIGSTSGVLSGIVGGTLNISYTVSAGGCSMTTSELVTISVIPPVALITGMASPCVGSFTTLAIATSGGEWSSGSPSVATVGSTGIVNGISTGLALITYTVSNMCGTRGALKLVTVTPGGDPATITGPSHVTAGSFIALSATVTGGTWSASNSHAAVSDAGIVTGITAGVVTISYTITNSCGASVATTVVTVDGDAPTISGLLAVCTGATNALGASIAGGTWSSSNSAVATVSASGMVTGVSSGVSAITYTTSSSSVSVNVTVTASTTIVGGATLCPGTTTTLSVGSSGGTWTGGSTVVATMGSAGNVTGIGAGTTTFTYSLGSGCNASITVTVNPSPAVISGTLKACPGTNTTLSCGTTGGTWYTSDASIVTADAATGVFSGLTAGTATVTYATGLGCYRTATYTVNPTPDAITGSMVICTGGIATLSDVTPGLSWSSSNTSVATIASNGVVNGVSAGNTTITYTAATGCLATAVLSVNGIPATIGGPATGCTGSPVTLTNAVPGGLWSSSNTSVATVDAATGVVTGLVSGMATITFTTGSGCFKTKAITINNSPTITGYPTACVGLTTTLYGGSGTWISGTPSVATIAYGGYVTAVSAGTSTMTFTPTAGGCPATYVVTVIPVPAAIAGPAQMCTGSVVTLTNTTPGGVWTSANTAIATVGSATGITTAVGTGGTATISYSFGNNCRVIKSIIMKPLPTVISGTAAVCSPMTTTLAVGTSGGTWTSSDASVATVGTTSSAIQGIVTGVSAGTADVTYTITATGCARSTVVTVNAGLNPGIITSSSGFTLHTVSPLTSVTLSSTGASGGTWSSSNPAVATVNSLTGVVTAVAAGTTTITYSVTNSCTNMVTKLITVTAGRPAITQRSSVANVELYPNPTTGAFTLVSDDAGSLNVYSIDGKEISSYDVNPGVNSLNLQREIASGIYMCKFTSESGSTTIVRLVVER